MGLTAGCFYLWLGYDPLKALSRLDDKDVIAALVQEG